MAKLNVIGAIIIAMAMGATMYFTQQKPQNSPNQITSQQKTISNPTDKSYLNEINELKEKLRFQEEVNAQLRKTNKSLETQKVELEESKIQLEESNTQLSSKVEEIEKRRGRRGKNREKKNASPYTLGEKKNNEERKGRRRGWGDPEQRKKWMSMRMIKDLPSLTQEQKDFQKALDEDFKEFRIQMIRNQENLSREEMRTQFGEKMEEYQVQVFSLLTEEQTAELNGMVEKEMAEREKRRQEESSD